jgi:exopolyphosphatase/guanosine-5'-triphosphate,3'-diphosphate pyrophosphatase
MTQPIAALSIGSDDLHLLVGTSDGKEQFSAIADHSMLVQLIGAMQEGTLPRPVLDQTWQDLGTLVAQARAAGAQTVIALATEVMRQATNGPAFIEQVRASLGIEAEIIAGKEEAALDYSWATFPPEPAFPVLAVDSGGGSTQVILGETPAQHDGRPTFATSLPAGGVNMSRRFFQHDPPAAAEMEALAAHVDQLLQPLPATPRPQSAVFMGGSATTLVRMATGGSTTMLLTAGDLEALLTRLQQQSAATVAAIEHLPLQRAKILPAGAVILQRLLTRYRLHVARVKPHNIRAGLIVRYARDGAEWRARLPLAPNA